MSSVVGSEGRRGSCRVSYRRSNRVATSVATERMFMGENVLAILGDSFVFKKVAGARRERSVRRHRQGCRPAVLKFEQPSCYCVHRRPFRVAAYSSGEVVVLNCVAASTDVHRRCYTRCYRNSIEEHELAGAEPLCKQALCHLESQAIAARMFEAPTGVAAISASAGSSPRPGRLRRCLDTTLPLAPTPIGQSGCKHASLCRTELPLIHRRVEAMDPRPCGPGASRGPGPHLH